MSTPEPAAQAPATTGVPHPAVDVGTAERAIVLTNRDVVGLSSWLVDAVLTELRAGRLPTLVTGPDATVTPAVRGLAATGQVHWLVQLPDGRLHDALGGDELALVDGVITVPDDRSTAPEFTAVTDADRATAAWQVITAATIEHRADVGTRLGAGIEALARALVGAAPAGWGLYEPVTEAWRPEDYTAFARRRMPEPTQIVVTVPPASSAGRALLATVTARRSDRGVEDQIDAVACVGGLDLPYETVLDRSRDALVALAESGTVGFAWTFARPGRADLNEVPRERSAPVPTAVLVGPRAVRALGADHVRAAPLASRTAVGRPRVPGFVFGIGGGPADDRDPWRDLDVLVRHLGPQRIVEVSPAFAEMLGLTWTAEMLGLTWTAEMLGLTWTAEMLGLTRTAEMLGLTRTAEMLGLTRTAEMLGLT